jgi:protein-tyrosine phosphatase
MNGRESSLVLLKGTLQPRRKDIRSSRPFQPPGGRQESINFVMKAEPFWITPQLAIIPRPHGNTELEDEMRALRDAGIDTVVSMLEPYEAKDVGLEREAEAAEHAGLRFVNFSVPDRGTPPNLDNFTTLLSNLEAQIAKGRKVGIHCRACIGRASVVAAGLLIRSGIPAARAWRQISAARGCSVPDTAEQRAWVERHLRSAA